MNREPGMDRGAVLWSEEERGEAKGVRGCQ